MLVMKIQDLIDLQENKSFTKENLIMKTKLILTLLLTILFTPSSLLVKAATIEEGVAGISTILDRIDPIEIKTALNYMWTTDKVNFRKEANTDSDIIETLDKRTKIQKITSSDSWIKVKHGGVIGYIHSDYLTDVEPPSLNFTNKEVKILERIVEAECTGQSVESKMNVASVIINRVININFPDDIENVVFQEDQFSPVNDKRFWSVEITDDTTLAVKTVIEDGVTNDEALFFCNMNDIKKLSNLEWFNKLKILFTDDSGHTFYTIIKE
jgi:hypothetical protein